MTQHKRAKLVATVGPASSTPQMIASMIEAGVDVFRINMSHANHEVLHRTVSQIREASAALSRNVAALVDLQGPKLRIGAIAVGEVAIEKGQEFRFSSRAIGGDQHGVHLPHPEIFAAIAEGDRLLLDDGKLSLETIAVGPFDILVRAIHAGKISGKKGVSLPDTKLPIGALTKKDRHDLDAALACGADWIALSFVQSAQDVEDIQRIVRKRAGVISKIEKPQALDDLDDIIELSDAVMVARGDLGVEMPLEQVPSLQKRIVRRARHFGRPVVVATQMLESMISAPVPTRAEVSDVSFAVLEGADAVMLSAESAAGKFPLEAVMMMTKIIEATETSPDYVSILEHKLPEPLPRTTNAISRAAKQIAGALDIAAIVAYTTTGATASAMSRERPPLSIIALSPTPQVTRRLAMVWGVEPLTMEEVVTGDELADKALALLKSCGRAVPGDLVAITAGIPANTAGNTNLLRIAAVN